MNVGQYRIHTQNLICIIDLPFDWFGISSMTTDIFCFHFQNSQTGGQWYSDTSPFSIPCLDGKA
jgi:hypothetical protein